MKHHEFSEHPLISLMKEDGDLLETASVDRDGRISRKLGRTLRKIP